MTTLALAATLALMLVLIAAHRSRRRLDTWVCRLCRRGFSSLPDAELHLRVAHHR